MRAHSIIRYASLQRMAVVLLVCPVTLGASQVHAQAPHPSRPAAVAPTSVLAAKAPFRGVRYFFVPSQKRYRAVKFSTGDIMPAGFLAWSFSSGEAGESCFNGRGGGTSWSGRVYVPREGRDYRVIFSLDDLLVGRPTSSPPQWFKKRARQQRNSSGYCGFGFAWPSPPPP